MVERVPQRRTILVTVKKKDVETLSELLRRPMTNGHIFARVARPGAVYSLLSPVQVDDFIV